MRGLPLRRFPDTITRRRRGEGRRNRRGEWVPGDVMEHDYRASVQPEGLTDADDVGGTRLVDRIKVYIPGEDMVLAAFDDQEPDRIRWKGRTYVVERSMSWTGSHTLRSV